MLKADKERIVTELAERLKGAQTLFVADYRGLSVSEIDDLRTKLIEHGARFTVVKNTLTRRAAEAAGSEALLGLLEGPTAIAFIDADGDMVGVAKALADAARTTKVLAVRGGILDGSPIGEEDVKSLAALPPVDVLRGQVLGAIIAPLTTIVGLISAPVRDLLGLIDARIEQLKEAGDTTAPEPSDAVADVSEAPGPAAGAATEGEAETAEAETAEAEPAAEAPAATAEDSDGPDETAEPVAEATEDDPSAEAGEAADEDTKEE
jgi:large subunit ribosomal protein L10